MEEGGVETNVHDLHTSLLPKKSIEGCGEEKTPSVLEKKN